jgi:hypothetical protein
MLARRENLFVPELPQGASFESGDRRFDTMIYRDLNQVFAIVPSSQ